LDKRDDKEDWDVGRGRRKLAIANNIDDFFAYERKNDSCASNGDLNRGPSASSYFETRMWIAGLLE
jgi:hypothetical protein